MALLAVVLVDRRGRAVQRNAPQVVIGAPRFLAVGRLGREHHRLAVGRDGEVLVAAERLGRRIAVEAVHQRDRGARGDAGLVQLQGVEVVLGPVVPGVPVADEQLVVDHAGGLLRALGGQLVLGALQGVAVGEHGLGDDDRLAVGRDLEGADVERGLGHLDGGLAGRVGAIDLVQAAGPSRDEVQALAVRRPAGAAGPAVGNRQPARRHPGLQVGDPQRHRGLVGREVHRPYAVDHEAAVRRHARIADPLQLHHVLGGEAAAASLRGARAAGATAKAARDRARAEAAMRKVLVIEAVSGRRWRRKEAEP
jgi:hypothetical protein